MKQPDTKKQDFMLTPEDENYVYSRIGMALISAQRVEFLTGKLLENLTEFDKTVYGITTSEFLEHSSKSKDAVKTLGSIFKLLKLNPKLVVEYELNDYLKKRNLFIHKFWETYLSSKSVEQAKKAVDFCFEFGQFSDRVTSFFKGFLFFLALRHVIDRDHIDPDLKMWNKDFEYFMASLDGKKLQ
ncbi:MAG: hypothetical protein Q8M08_10710 [Bacteroidales bacterium]|nr:hypothetical protein [Bacteroidales bacterium]